MLPYATLKDRFGLAFGFATGRMTMGAFEDGSGSTTSTFEEMLTFFLEPTAFATGLMTIFFLGGSAGGGRGGGAASPGALLEALVRVEVVVRVDSTLRLRPPPLELGARVLAEPMLLGGRPLAFGAGAGVAIGGSIVAVSGVCGIGIGGVKTGGADGAGSGMGSRGPVWGTVG